MKRILTSATVLLVNLSFLRIEYTLLGQSNSRISAFYATKLCFASFVNNEKWSVPPGQETLSQYSCSAKVDQTHEQNTPLERTNKV